MDDNFLWAVLIGVFMVGILNRPLFQPYLEFTSRIPVRKNSNKTENSKKDATVDNPPNADIIGDRSKSEESEILSYTINAYSSKTQIAVKSATEIITGKLALNFTANPHSLVSCGNTNVAIHCGECTKGRGASDCMGDCVWKNDMCVSNHQLIRESRNASSNIIRVTPREKCSSPEMNASWVLKQCHYDGASQNIYVGTQSEKKDGCELCGEETELLRQIRDSISTQYQSKCNKMVVYGAAFGRPYEQWLADRSFLGKRHQQLYRNETCFFQFVSNLKTPSRSAEGSQILIPVNTSMMPYKSDRRNVTIFKMSPGLLFPWAERIIWQDTKLLNARSHSDMPTNYSRHFYYTIDRSGACASFMALPKHRNTVYPTTESVSVASHSQAIIQAAKKRPTVSDDLNTVLKQAQFYYQFFSSRDDEGSRVYHQNPLIDGAFLVWDIRSEVCGNFNRNLGCSWLSEIHCHSDRDQLSFPSALALLGLHLQEPSRDVLEDQDRLYANDKNQPRVHISDPKCHWYFGKFSQCVAQKMKSIHHTTSSKGENVRLR